MTHSSEQDSLVGAHSGKDLAYVRKSNRGGWDEMNDMSDAGDYEGIHHGSSPGSLIPLAGSELFINCSFSPKEKRIHD